MQLDPSDEGTYSPGVGRSLFQIGEQQFGVAICQEGWRHPETVRWEASRGAHIVFHPHFHGVEPGGYRPSSFPDPANSFHEKTALCRSPRPAGRAVQIRNGDHDDSVQIQICGRVYCGAPAGGKHLIRRIVLFRAKA